MTASRAAAVLAATALAALAAGASAPAAPAPYAAAPGAVAFPTDATPTIPRVDPLTPVAPALLPDGGTVLAGPGTARTITVVARTRDGAPETAFGTGGVARPAVAGPVQALQVLRRPDGRLLVVFATYAARSTQLPRLEVAQLTPTGQLDATFGSHGVASPGVQQGFGQPGTVAVLQPDGSLLVGGVTGRDVANPSHPDATASIGRLTATGLPAGVTTLAAPGKSVVYAVAATPGGGAAAVGTNPDGTGALFRVTATGAPDSAFNHGAAVALPAIASQVVAHPDGTIDVLAKWRVVRYSAAGVRDLTFGGADGVGPIIAGTENTLLLTRPDGSDVTLGLNFPGQGPAPLSAVVIHPDGTPDAPVQLRPPFRGGFFSEPGAAVLQRAHPAYWPAAALVRPDGTLLVTGTVQALTYLDEGEGYEHEEAALMSYTNALAPDPAFGSATATAPLVTLRLPAPARRAGARALRLRLASTQTGLADVRVRVGGTVVAQTTLPVVATGPRTVSVPLTKRGRRLLAGRARRHATASARVTGFLGTIATATARGTLR